MQRFEIQQFMPEKSQKNRVWLLIGGRNTGKSVLLKDLLHKTQRDTDFAMAMTATISSAKMFKSIMPPDFVYTEGYDFNKGDKFLEATSSLSELGKIRNATLCLDDVMFNSKVMKCTTQSNLHLNGRHYNTSIFSTTQYAMLIPTSIRSNVDYVFAMKETIRANRKRLWEHYFGCFSTFADFDRVFTECTRDHGALVLDRTQSSGKLEDLVKYYKASLDVPKFRIGRSVFHKAGPALREILESRKKRTKPTTVKNIE